MSGSTFHIVVAEPYSASALGRLQAAGRVTVLPDCEASTLREALVDCDALLVRTYSRITADILDRAKRLRVIGRGGVGLDNIDVQAAQTRGITVVYTPAAATESVADLTIGMILALLRGIVGSDRMVRSGLFTEARQSPLGRELGDLTIGIVGMGRIGKAVARRCHCGFGMPVLYNDIVAIDPLGFTATQVDKVDLYGQADVVSLHVPLTPKTHHMIDEAALAKMSPTTLLVNTARGAVVDNSALAKALEAGRPGGAALDVFDPEPLPADHPLLAAPNTLLTAHIAARTVGGQQRMNDVVDDVIRVLEGQQPNYPADRI